jgi:putative aldouronate transport system substrate-binding protein
MIENNRAGNILSATKAGAFWEVGKYMKDYPNLSKANPDIMKNVSVDGKVYGIYRKRAVARNGIIYRKDWLDNLGMKKPKTIDDVYEMLKAFTLKDPDKNGKNDTFGYSESSKLPYASTGEIFAWFGSPNRWGLADGKLVPDFMTPEYMNALKYLQKMYSEKLMNQDFAVTKDRYDNMNAGKVGAVIGALGDISSRFGNLYKLNPKAELDFTTSIDGVKGPRVMGGAGNGGLIMFPKSSVKTEAQLKQLLNFFDQLNNEQISKLLQFGIEGMHYKMVDGKVTVTAEQSKQMVADSQDLGQLKTLDLYDFPVSDPLKERIAKAFSDMEKIAVPNPTVPLQSPTQSKLGAQLDKIWQDAQIKFIMGASNENEYKQSIEQWRKQGGDKIIAEFSDDYAKSKGN